MLANVLPERIVQRRVAGRNAVVGGALEHGEVGRGLREHRRALDAGGPGADQADPLAAEVHPIVRPLASVVPAPREARQAWNVRQVGRGQAAHGRDQEMRAVALAGVGLDQPAVGRRVVAGGSDPRLQADVGPQCVAIGHVVQVAQDLGLSRVALGPLPLAHQILVEEILVGVALGVAARARIAIPVPGAAHAVGGLENQRLHAEMVAQAQQLVHAREACADDQGVDLHAVAPGIAPGIARGWRVEGGRARSWGCCFGHHVSGCRSRNDDRRDQRRQRTSQEPWTIRYSEGGPPTGACRSKLRLSPRSRQSGMKR